LDYSKGIPQRLSAFELFLQTQPNWRGKVTYLQIAVCTENLDPA
jgi:trehalose 6-phosphate synthase